MNRNTNVLLVEDSVSLSAVYQAYLSEGSFAVRPVGTLEDARAALSVQEPDIVLLDLELPDGNGIDLLKELSEGPCQAEVIIMTAYGSSDLAVEAIRMGAFDFLTKPFDASRLLVTIENATRHQQLHRKVQLYSELEREQYCDFIGKSLAMQSVYRTIDSLAASSATGFICGESGTGKELAANAIHEKSARSGKEIVAINCGAIPGDLMESELFGHIKGAFTGATSNRDGAAKAADGGTLFLDEICELDLDLQKKLLRFIQTGTFQKVGSNKTEQVDIRFVCATNRDPLEEVRQGRFREDLYYRLHVVPVELPPLRERDEDVLQVANVFLKQFAAEEGRDFDAFSRDAQELMLAYQWPGNVRELQNVIQRTVVLHEGGTVSAAMLPITLESKELDEKTQTVLSVVPRVAVNNGVADSGAVEPLWLTEKRAIEHAIKQTGDNINKAAALLDVAPSTLYRKIQAWKKQDLAG